MRFWILGAMIATAPLPLLAQRSLSPQEKAVGAEANPKLLAQYGGAMSGPAADYVTRIARRVAVQSGLSNSASDFTIALLDSPVENAFAIPGGYVYVTRQLLALMNSEGELASVLGHEIGHVAARHSAKRSSRSTIGSILAAGIGVATGSSALGQAAGYGAQLYTLSFSRTQEYEADGLGVRYIAGAGYDPYAASAMLDSLDRETRLQSAISGKSGSNVPVFARTHPNGPDRVARASQLAASLGAQPKAEGQDTAFLRSLDGLPYDDAKSGHRVAIVTASPKDTIASLSSRMVYPDHRSERFMVLNGLADDAVIQPGRLYKIIVGR
ncbi:M48 family metalloprotease [Sphingomonas sp. BIUV-7]|uniref:M48 family metalloprotease n=2 Tax=Sphingomonas natans TaxID=3063330 RepID=A0ABT8Y487_9SPHN|nr:M48 family metalloprotease [Sphingomonas sp. BIUV-7]